MFKLSENYYHRKCYLERDQVPTQTVMMNKMTASLAKVYFKSMTPKLKVLAGLEPQMKGGGSDWYIPPKTLLEERRAVMKPLKKEFLSKLGFEGISFFGEKSLLLHRKRQEKEKNRILQKNDEDWKNTIETKCRQQWEDSSKVAANKNTEAMQQAFNEFSTLYMTSINKIETLILDAAIKEINRTKEQAHLVMQKKYDIALKNQATRLYDMYTKILDDAKSRHKNEFIANVETVHKELADQVHDLNVDKHIVIDKLRNLLEAQNLACQVYVALKEREECQKQTELSEYKHKKQVRALKEEIALKDFEIHLAIEKKKKREELNKIWKKKVCEVVKKFQKFVLYCLFTLPEHADFFLDMEKLMLLQLNDVLEEPEVKSLFEPEEPEFHTPVPKPHPFYLFCEKGHKPQIDQNLCPKHCTSSASQLPVIVVNKKCVYAACDNFEQFTDKVKQYIHGQRGDDADFEDGHKYSYDVPVKYSTLQQIEELKQESSLLQILQQEFSNIRDMPYCFCSPVRASKIYSPLPSPKENIEENSVESVSSGNKIETRSVELIHDREPKWESYCQYAEPRICKCPKTAKKHLGEHLPPYMQNMSTYDAPELPFYEKCSVSTLKMVVEKARGKRPPPPKLEEVESKIREVGTQYTDQEFDDLCTCFSDHKVETFLKELASAVTAFDKVNQFKIVDGSIPPTDLTKSTGSFATARAFSLRNLINDAPELKEIFVKKDCQYK